MSRAPLGDFNARTGDEMLSLKLTAALFKGTIAAF
jgi:hypothetical protein